MTQHTLKVEGMSCGHCKAAVEGSLNQLDGLQDVQVSLETGQVDVTYDDAKLSLDEIKAAIEDQGYDVV